jgi:heat shock protein HtpX
MIKRVVLFLGTNLAVMFILGIIINLLGLNQPGQNWTPLIIMAGIMGMAGSFISLMMSKSMAQRAVGAQIIETPRNQTEAWLVQTIRTQAQQAGIGMPDVAIFDSPAPNAFATGADKNNALVAVSTGLLSNMNQDEVEAVLGHEMTHVSNGDMVTMALLQGVVNTFVIVFAHVLAGILDRGRNDNGYSRPGIGYYVGYMVAQTVLGFLATMIVMWFSRQREFRADAGGAGLAGRPKMIAALQALQRVAEPSHLPDRLQAFGINGGLAGDLKKLFMSHPPLADRIAALQAAQ